jgi:hypothetical protein
LKKSLPVIVILSLILSGLGAAAITNDMTYDVKTEEQSFMSTILVSPLIIEELDSENIEVHLKDVSTYLMNPGQPMLPKVIKTVELAFGVNNIEINVIPTTVKIYDIAKKVRPAPAHVLLTEDRHNMAVKTMEDKETYSSSELFPSTWYEYKIGCGLNANNERITHVSIHFFPVRYVPAEGKLYVAESADVEITYVEPTSCPFTENSEYDLVIIAPSRFSLSLQRFVRHKNNHGVSTILKTTRNIYSEYPGVDKPEQIKYFIKDAIEEWGVKYVLLVGGLKSLVWGKARDDTNQGSKSWYVPV